MPETAGNAVEKRGILQGEAAESVVYVIGETESANFPVTAGVFGPQYSGGGRDLFILKIAGVVPPDVGEVTTVSAASFSAPVAGGSIATAFAALPVEGDFSATVTPLPTVLDGISLEVVDSAGSPFTVDLFFVGPTQVNFFVPEDTAPGTATVNIRRNGQLVAGGQVLVSATAPGIFFVGNNVAAAFFLVVEADGTRTQPRAFADDLSPFGIDLGSDDTQVFLLLFGTGIRRAATVSATVAGRPTPVLGFVPQGDFVGLDQVNLGPIPKELAAAGAVEVVLTVDGVESNPVTIRIQ